MTTNTIRRIVVTAGEPAGIGPDLVLALSKEDWAHQIVVCADKNMLTERAKQLGIEVQLSDYNPEEAPKAQKAGTLIVDHIQISE
ncbi:4-hydroxythreonine-4-phosphate dehydrogenase PdxA, partial [Vibrio parahaemolyticus]|nr:4-hydroxythreonine-4-phosphate dehydrogenase PdxA [Vibrio parahaemolyticus]